MNSKPLTLALIGLGRFGRNHLRVLKELESQSRCRLIRVCDTRGDVLRLASKEYHINVTNDYNEILEDDDISAVDLVTPIATHYDLCREFLKAGKDVFVEKPLADTGVKARKLAELAKQKNQILMVGHIFRYTEVTRIVKEQISSGELGKIFFMHGRFIGVKPRKDRYGVIMSDAVHHIDLFNFFMDSLPKKVSAKAQYCLGGKQDDLALIFLDYGNVFAYIELSCISPIKSRELTVVGSSKGMTADLLKQQVEIHAWTNDEATGSLGRKTITTRPRIVPTEPLKVELLEFINSLTSRIPPPTDGRAGANAVMIAEAALRSIESEGEVEI